MQSFWRCEGCIEWNSPQIPIQDAQRFDPLGDDGQNSFPRTSRLFSFSFSQVGFRNG